VTSATRLTIALAPEGRSGDPHPRRRATAPLRPTPLRRTRQPPCARRSIRWTPAPSPPAARRGEHGCSQLCRRRRGKDELKYLTVWQRDSAGAWRIIRDINNSDLPAKKW